MIKGLPEKHKALIPFFGSSLLLLPKKGIVIMFSITNRSISALLLFNDSHDFFS